MKRFLCLLMVVLIFTGLCGCEKDNGSLPADNTDITDNTDISDLSMMESSEITSSEITSLAVPDNSEVSDESNVSAPDDGRIEELEEEITRLNSMLTEANSEIEKFKKQISDLEKQIDESGNQIDNSLMEIIQMNGGACLYLYGEYLDYCNELKILYADKSIQTIFNDQWMTSIEPSPDGSKVVMNDFEPEGDGSDVFLFDVNARETRELLMSELPVNYAASFMGWLDNRYFLFVSQFDHGTVAIGGNVYVYDTQTDKYRLLIENEDKYHQVCSFDISSEDFILFRAIKYDQEYAFTTHVNYSITVSKIYELINGNKTMNLKEALNMTVN